MPLASSWGRSDRLLEDLLTAVGNVVWEITTKQTGKMQKIQARNRPYSASDETSSHEKIEGDDVSGEGLGGTLDSPTRNI